MEIKNIRRLVIHMEAYIIAVNAISIKKTGLHIIVPTAISALKISIIIVYFSVNVLEVEIYFAFGQRLEWYSVYF